MKTRLIAVALFTMTVSAVLLMPLSGGVNAIQTSIKPQPPQSLQPQQAGIDVVFALDTTGSMSGLIEASKEKIWSIASSMAQAEQAPEIRMGLVAYRDRGDDYVTQVTDLSSDLDSMFARLMDFRAAGGGDGPESVNKALYDAVHQVSWRADQNTYRVIFLVGDAPPHRDYQDEAQFPQIVAQAKRKGIVINTIQAGNSSATARPWRQIAALGAGQYFQVAQNGNAVAIATPFDDQLAELSEQLDDTRVYYGDAAKRAEKQNKVAASRKLHRAASVESRARRAAFNASASGAANLIGDSELVEDLASGRVAMDDIEPEKLPESLKAMAPAAQLRYLEQAAETRQQLKQEISELAQQRDDFLKKKVEAAGGAIDSLDAKIYGAVRAQAADRGLSYEAEAPSY